MAGVFPYLGRGRSHSAGNLFCEDAWRKIVRGSPLRKIASAHTALALDTEGNIYVTGITNSGDLNGSQDAFAGTTDVFLAKFSNDGSRLLGAKTWGGPGYDAAAALSFDGSGNVLVVGATAMPDNLAHATYFRLDAAWSQLDTVTFGGSFIDLPTGVAVALSGRICIVGDAGSEDFPVTADALTPRLTGGLNAFMMLLDFAR